MDGKRIVNKTAEKKQRMKMRKQNTAYGTLAAPIVIWTVLLIILPLLYLLFMSFMTKGLMGSIKYQLSLDSYKMIFDPVYAVVLEKSLVIALWSTVACVILGYPLAYFIAMKGSKKSRTYLLMLMIPFWTCVLVVIYSFVILLSNSGIINSFLLNLGIISKPKQLLYTDGAVMIGMVYNLLPFAVMPMYSSIEKMDFGLVEASKDLGAGPVKTFFKITLPMTKPGIFAAVILVFIPCIGYYMITDMLGGGTSIMIGNVIYNQFTSARNWPFGAALSIVLAAIILIMLRVYTKLGGDLDDLGG